jgi:galactofuranosylgalactofuranosylrhamnosyl-N-acetylglucosaminyl-diphospho-decaprenol beta-1,5/1,6-galactofuranosyltransferase
MDADYNGWWMCLIPRTAIERCGLPLPAFIKWDDAEYSLRAGRAGIPTVSLPGVALWHISWVGKDDLIDWQAYFHARNRIVSALLHSAQRGGGSLLTHSRRVDIKHLMSMQYYPVALRHRALRAVLSGPEHLHPDLRKALPAARALAAEYPETAPVAMPEDARTPSPTGPAAGAEMPTGAALRVFMIRSLISQWFRRPRASASDTPEAVLRAGEARWWQMVRYDSAVVTMAGTASPHLYVRDRDAYRSLLRESIRLHRELRRRWGELAESYRAADITTLGRWMRTLHPSPDEQTPEIATPPSS